MRTDKFENIYRFAFGSVSFAVAELLKKAGYNEPTYWFYFVDDIENKVVFDNDNDFHDWNSEKEDNPWYSAPPLQDAIRFIREEHHHHITTRPYMTEEGVRFYYQIYNLDSENFTPIYASKAGYTTCEACENATLKFALENIVPLNQIDNGKK